MVEEVLLATMPLIPGYVVEDILGLVTGSSVRTRGFGGRFISGLQSIKGGRGSAYLSEIEKARTEALEELKTKASEAGANAVLYINFETTEILEGFIVVTVYGTAVKIRREE